MFISETHKTNCELKKNTHGQKFTILTFFGHPSIHKKKRQLVISSSDISVPISVPWFMTINHHHLNKKKQHHLDFHPPELPGRFFVAPTGAAGVDGAPHALTDITVLLADSAAVLTTVTWALLNSTAVLSKTLKN